MDKFLHTVEQIWNVDLVRFIVYLAIAFVAAGIAKWLVTTVFEALKLNKLLDKWGINEGKVGTSMSFVGKLVYLVVFLLFVPSAFSAIGMTSISSPITGLASTFIAYLPKIIAAVITVYVGLFIAQILGNIVAVLLKKTKIDSLIKSTNEENKRVLLSDLIVKILMGIIILITVVQAIIYLEIDAVSGPALAIVNAIFKSIPDIILAVVVLALGIFVTELACGLIYNLLLAVNLDKMVKKVLPQIKASATKVTVNVIKTILIFFFAAQAIEALNLSILTVIVTSLIGYLPMVIKAFVVLAVAFVGATLLESFIIKSNPNAAKLAKIVKAAIYTVAGFMILSQLGIATEIVNKAFVITLAAIAVSFALAFGLGGRDFAKKTLDRVDEKIEQNKNDK